MLQASFVEIVAALASLAYVVLAIYSIKWCWVLNVVSTILYTKIFINEALYFNAMLQIFFLFFSVTGFLNWSKPKQHSITSYNFKRFLTPFFLLFFISVVLAFLFKTYTNASMPMSDALIFTFSIYATYLTTIKVIENWHFWFCINILATIVFYVSQIYFTSLLYFVFIFFAYFGYVKWKSEMQKG
jgi:nicotinamide mononucleotide transporter